MSSVVISGDVSGTVTLSAPSAAGSTVLTLPVIATDTLAGIAATQTLTNKTLTSPALSGTVTGTYTLGGTPTLTAPALGTPASGVLTNCTGVPAAALPAGSVLRVVSTTKTDTFTSTTYSAWTDITGITVSITPRSTSSKILITFNISASNPGDNTYIRLMRDATPICIGDAASLRKQASSGNFLSVSGAAVIISGSNTYLDSPSSVSAIVYKVQFWTGSSGFYLNRSPTDSDAAGYSRTASTITVQEIQG